MRGENDPAATAKAIIDANLYMVLGTADEAGRPWVSPVYYAPVAYQEFLWVSRPETLHSRNLIAQPDISIVIFDSSVPIGTGQGVYMAATAKEVTRRHPRRRDRRLLTPRSRTRRPGVDARGHRAAGRDSPLPRDRVGALHPRFDRPTRRRQPAALTARLS
jgi:nitroimidazol reductase NimA-like FMN-containing flavoprotein (pyridoxamine 5'-phosphate oxidase superfamily)